MTITKEDLEPGDIFLVSGKWGDNLFEVHADQSPWYRMRATECIVATCFFGPWRREEPYWIDLVQITEVFKK